MRKNKQEVITFKADESLLDAMKGIPNRSEFIRKAILSSLGNVCPSCKGTGYVSLEQKVQLDKGSNGTSLHGSAEPKYSDSSLTQGSSL